jgi:RNA polymerase sigma-70 factor (ECF subfamily)
MVLMALTLLTPAFDEPTLDTVPPVVVKTEPQAGSNDVNPGQTEIRVTFSKPMMDKSWSWSTLSPDSFPKITGTPHYAEDGRTCLLPVDLKPGKTYAIWVNSGKFHNFKDRDQRPAVPYLLVFQTRKAD